MNTILWILAIVLGVSLVLQGIVLRNAYRRKLAMQLALQLRFQQEMNGRLEQTKRQISQLQIDLAAARQQLKQLGKGDAALVQDSSPARQALERELDEPPPCDHPCPSTDSPTPYRRLKTQRTEACCFGEPALSGSRPS